MADPDLPPDHVLIERIRSGDETVVAELLASYWSPLVEYAGGILPDAADAQDVVQEAFIRLWARREQWGTDGSVRALLYTMTRHAALDERRRETRRERAAREAEPMRPLPSPSDDALDSELRRAAAVAVSALPPKRQEVFRLVREEGLSYKETAQVMGLSPQTVANQMSLALADLRKALAPSLAPGRLRRTEEGPSPSGPIGVDPASEW